MKFYTLCLGVLLSLCFTATARSVVPRQQIIEQLKTLRNTISNAASYGRSFRSYQDSCHFIINEAIARIDGREVDFTQEYQQSLEGLIELARQMQFYRRSNRYTLLCTIYAHLQLTFKNELG